MQFPGRVPGTRSSHSGTPRCRREGCKSADTCCTDGQTEEGRKLPEQSPRLSSDLSRCNGDSLPGDYGEKPFTQKLAPQPRVVLDANRRPLRDAGTLRPRSVLRCSVHGRSHLSANRRQQLSELPGDEPRMQLGGWSPGVLRVGIPKGAPPLLPSSRPSFGSLPGRVFLLQVWVSARKRCQEVEEPCKPRGRQLYVNQPRHLPARCRSARARSKAERTKTQSGPDSCSKPG